MLGDVETVVIPSRAGGEGPHSRTQNHARSLSRTTKLGVANTLALICVSSDRLRGPSPSARLGMTTHLFATAYFTLRFFEQPNVADLHFLIHRLAHVVDGEQGDRHAGQRFHLHPGLRHGARGAFHFQPRT